MSTLYGPQHRDLQDRFGTRALADRIENLACRTDFDEASTSFIQAQDMFFLSTVDHDGWPTVSYKGGDPGFVRIESANTLSFPSYDGNGMFLSVGNASHDARVGMLFVSFERPFRIRLRGRARVLLDHPRVDAEPMVDAVVEVTLEALWQNCPRYVHRYEKVAPSRYVPQADTPAPLAQWKRVDLLQDVLPERDAQAARAAGTIDIEHWMQQIASGDPEA